jgi:hypothetical protein
LVSVSGEFGIGIGGVWYRYQGSLVSVSGEFGIGIGKISLPKLLYNNDLKIVRAFLPMAENYENYEYI